MGRSPLILSPSHDIHAAAVNWGLRQWGVEPLWPRSAGICDRSIGGVGFSTEGHADFTAEGALSFDRIGAVWYRRCTAPRDFGRAHPSDLAFLGDQWRLCQLNFLALVEARPDVFCVNAPAAARHAENKLVQLNAAIASGLTVPATLVSNEPTLIARFRSRHRNVIYKSFTVHGWQDDDGTAGRIAQAHLLDPDLPLDDDQVRLCPGILQAYVDKVADIRVTLIGHQCFATRLGTTAGAAFVDWRGHVDGGAFVAQPFNLPDVVRERLQALMSRMGLVFGCVDLALDRSGELHFLEINQGGQFLFAERWVEAHPLLHAMCAMLVSARSDYTMEKGPLLSYRHFRDSDEYAAWQQDYEAWAGSEKARAEGLSIEPAAARTSVAPVDCSAQ